MTAQVQVEIFSESGMQVYATWPVDASGIRLQGINSHPVTSPNLEQLLDDDIETARAVVPPQPGT